MDEAQRPDFIDRLRRWYVNAETNFFESPRAQRERIFMHSLYVFGPIAVVLGIINAILGQWYLMIARFGLFAIIIVVYFLNRAGFTRAAVNTVFWLSTIVFGIISYLGNSDSYAVTAVASVFVASVAAGSILLVGLYAERRYQINIMFLISVLVSALVYFGAGDITARSLQLTLSVFWILVLFYIIARFEMHLSHLAENQLEARRMLNEQLEEIHVAESIALARTQQKFDEVNHDIRTPLTVAMNTLKALRGSPLSDAQKEYVDMLQRSYATILSIAEDRLSPDTTTPEAGSATLTVQVASFLDQISRQHRPFASANGTSIEIHVAADLPSIGIPLTDLTRIMNNLLHNAIKYTSNGTIEIFATLRQTSADTSSLKITVKDSGEGMVPSRLSEVRNGINGPDKAQSTSRGIGLRSARSLLQVVGGSMQIDSEPDSGTTVEISLPVVTK